MVAVVAARHCTRSRRRMKIQTHYWLGWIVGIFVGVAYQDHQEEVVGVVQQEQVVGVVHQVHHQVHHQFDQEQVAEVVHQEQGAEVVHQVHHPAEYE